MLQPTATEGQTSLTALQNFYKDQKVSKHCAVLSSARADLNNEVFVQERMNRGEKIMYDVNEELQEVLGIGSPSDRATIQKSFVDFCVEHDIVDLHCH